MKLIPRLMPAIEHILPWLVHDPQISAPLVPRQESLADHQARQLRIAQDAERLGRLVAAEEVKVSDQIL